MSIGPSGDAEERTEAMPGASAAVAPADHAEAAAPATTARRGFLRGDLGQLPVFIGLLVIAAYFQFASGGFFLAPENLNGLTQQVVSMAILAVAAVLVLLIGEIDLSLSAVAYFCGAVTGVLSVHHGWPASTAILAGIVVGVVIGAINGVLVAVLRMPSFIVTLAGFIFYQGALTRILSPQTTLQIYDPFIDGINTYNLSTFMGILIPAIALAVYIAGVFMARARRQRAGLQVPNVIQLALQIGLPVVITALAVMAFDLYQGVPVTAVITVGVIVIFWLLTTKTSFGRHIYAVGGNAEAARRAGIKVVGLRIAIFTLASVLSAVSGMLIISRGASAPAQVNQYLLLNAIAAAVIGGVSLFGGRGSVWGVVLGALIVGSLINGLALLNEGPDIVEMSEGLVLLAAVLIDAVARRRSNTGYR